MKSSHSPLLAITIFTLILVPWMILSVRPAVASNQRCDVVISVTNAIQANALQVELDHSAAADGDFVKDGCVVTGAPPAFAEVNVDGHALEIAWVNQATAFTAPALFATCRYFTNSPSATVEASDFVPSIKDCTRGNPPVACAPTVGVAVSNCTEVVPVCGNSTTELGEVCDEGPGGDTTCTSHCTPTANCTDLPLAGCRTGAPRRSKIQLRNDAKNATNEKDQGRFDWKNGEATSIGELGNPINGTASYYWCVYDAEGLVLGTRIRPGGTCDGKPCWKRSSPTKLQYQSKYGNTFGISQLRLAAGPDGKASIRVKAKSKVGNFAAPHGMPLTGSVVSQLIIASGTDSLCFESSFPTAGKNDASQFSAKGP